jgi:hypothetical protein
LRPATHFRRCRGRRVWFACFTLSDLFATVQSASGPIFLFCATRLVFGSIEGVESSFHVLQSRTHFRRFLGCRVQFSCFKQPDSFLATPRASGQVLMFCAFEPFFDGTESARSSFHGLRSQTYFGRYRGQRVQFSFFALPGLVLAVSEGAGSIFHVLRY